MVEGASANDVSINIRHTKLSQAQQRIKQLEEAIKEAGGTIPPLKASTVKKSHESETIPTPTLASASPPPISSGGAPPPPPTPGPNSPPPPPPPGCPPPPPPGGANIASPSGKEDIMSKLGMKNKKKWSIKENLKKTNWKAIPANKLTGLNILHNDIIHICLLRVAKSFWVNVEEEMLVSDTLMQAIQEKFSSKPPVRSEESKISKDRGKKKVKDLKVLDEKAAQNLSVILGIKVLITNSFISTSFSKVAH